MLNSLDMIARIRLPKFRWLLNAAILTMLATSLAPHAGAVSIISNYPVSGDNPCCTLLGLVTRSFAAGFTTPAGPPSQLDSVMMRLSVNAVGGTFTLQLFGGTAANPSGPALATFSVPTLNTLTAGSDFTFTTTTPFVLQPSTTYWLVAYSLTTGSANQIAWNQNTPTVVPAGTAVSTGYRYNSPAAVPPTGSLGANVPTFQVNATAITSTVPTLSVLGLTLCGILLLLTGVRTMMGAKRQEAAGAY